MDWLTESFRRIVALFQRDRISTDAWRFLSRIDPGVVDRKVQPALRVNRSLELLDRTLMELSAFSGIPSSFCVLKS